MTDDSDVPFPLDDLDDYMRDLRGLPPRAQPKASNDVLTISDTGAYARKALAEAVASVRNATEGFRNHTLNVAAFKLGRLIGADPALLDEPTANEHLTHAAEECGLGADEIYKTITSGISGGMKDPLAWRPAPDVFGPQTQPQARQAPPGDTPLHVPTALELEVGRLRLQRQARRALDAEEAQARYTPIAPLTLREHLARPKPAITFVIDKLLRYGFNATLTAPQKTGKTTMMAELVRALADGEPFLSRFDVATDFGRVALFDYEMDEWTHQDWLDAIGVREGDRVDVIYRRGHRNDLRDDTVAADVVKVLRQREIGVWIVDPFARAYRGDENDNSAVGEWLDRLDQIKREANVHSFVMPIHTGRREADVGDERSRGATRLDDWPDMLWKLSRDKDTGRRYFGAEGRGGDVPLERVDFDPITRRLTFGGGDVAWDRRRDRQRAVLEFIADHPGCGITAIRKGVRGDNAAIDACVRQLNVSHAIRIEEGGDGKTNRHFANVQPSPFDL